MRIRHKVIKGEITNEDFITLTVETFIDGKLYNKTSLSVPGCLSNKTVKQLADFYIEYGVGPKIKILKSFEAEEKSKF